ncbi:MAG: hypothetical protein GWN99_17495 [Gemmatimonadetes bacterium]|uniref:Uncharacterized protein n=1 Tax=Candidatus Kutchimonas denitrificans TaxID=3056748 RepID=A0AAE5CBK5_9BACT|nr:hypothetical protein [Gemmatimonadota bacterium]NIR74643.1 hypothetical protein [Candidatus Kutchimonas denitrificans]NIS02833.1 hypothetical protein [Gemmatimonadota bacterium]NIT68994.1 hypothetical protein [Gemmatimonadota bacterium]NIU52299.1 hypothetical protein [Gemmatimonadota bacterium]
MTSEKSWKIIQGAAGDDDNAGGVGEPLIECPRGHERRVSRQERTESVIWCEKCGQSYQIDWQAS